MRLSGAAYRKVGDGERVAHEERRRRISQKLGLENLHEFLYFAGAQTLTHFQLRTPVDVGIREFGGSLDIDRSFRPPLMAVKTLQNEN